MCKGVRSSADPNVLLLSITALVHTSKSAGGPILYDLILFIVPPFQWGQSNIKSCCDLYGILGSANIYLIHVGGSVSEVIEIWQRFNICYESTSSLSILSTFSRLLSRLLSRLFSKLFSRLFSRLLSRLVVKIAVKIAVKSGCQECYQDCSYSIIWRI